MEREDRKYAETHEWAMIDGDTLVVGISAHAQKALGDVTFVEAPEVGQEVTKGKECGTIESVKAAADLFAPATGVISAVNARLEDAPEVVNEDPYGEGWIFKITGFDASDLDSLLDAQAYESVVESEE